jgi:hypothetical protein
MAWLKAASDLLASRYPHCRWAWSRRLNASASTSRLATSSCAPTCQVGQHLINVVGWAGRLVDGRAAGARGAFQALQVARSCLVWGWMGRCMLHVR